MHSILSAMEIPRCIMNFSRRAAYCLPMAPTHALLMIPILLGITGCVVVDNNPGPVLTSSKRIESGSAEVVQAELRMGAGDLTIGSGAKSLLESAFRYSE